MHIIDARCFSGSEIELTNGGRILKNIKNWCRKLFVKSFYFLHASRDYSKLDLLPLFGVVKIFLELEIKITGLGNSNFV